MKKKMRKFNAIGNVIGVLFLIGILICIGSAGSFVVAGMSLYEFIVAEAIGMIVIACCYRTLMIMVEEYNRCHKKDKRRRKAA